MQARNKHRAKIWGILSRFSTSDFDSGEQTVVTDCLLNKLYSMDPDKPQKFEHFHFGLFHFGGPPKEPLLKLELVFSISKKKQIVAPIFLFEPFRVSSLRSSKIRNLFSALLCENIYGSIVVQLKLPREKTAEFYICTIKENKLNIFVTKRRLRFF